MKINEFHKQKDGYYEVVVGHEKVRIHEDLILKYNLLITKELTPDILEKIRKENQVYDAYQIALKLLKTRVRSTKEIIDALIKKGFAKEQIASCNEILQKQGYLNDKTYAIAYLHDKINMSTDGPFKIRKSLEKNGVEESIIHEIMMEFTPSLQKEKIEKIIQKGIKTNRNKSSKVLMQKILLSLVNQGYDRSMSSSILENYTIDEEEIKKQEYQKVYNQLSKKYYGSELEFRVKQKMYQKGFRNIGE